MLDFLGKELKVGDYVVAGGSGNSSAEYGSILYRIHNFSKTRINCRRLKIRRNWSDKNKVRLEKCELISSISSASLGNPTRLTAVTPHKKQVEIFDNPTKYPNVVGKWLHGAEQIDWDNISLS